MTAKKPRSSTDKKANSTIRTLGTKLQRTEEKAARWKEKAKLAQAEVGRLTARIDKLEKKLAKAKAKNTARGRAPALDGGRVASLTGEAPGDPGALQQSTGSPDATWTVAQLRAEARSRGLTGLSNKPKSVLIDALG